MIINGKRSLAYIQTVHDIQPIVGADNIELVHVNAWTLIAKKGEFQDGDKCVFFEIDSKLPADNPAFAFLAAKHYKVKTYKLGKFGVVSQGLALPLSVLPEIDPAIELNTDVTDLLKVEYSVREDNYRKAEDPAITRFKKYKGEHLKFYSNRFIKWLMRFKWFLKLQVRLHGGKVSKKYNFPTQYVSKTDEERCLIGDTKIMTNYGPLRIADIVNKGLIVNVASYNLERQEIEYKPITATSVIKCEEPMIKITVPYKPNCARKNTIICTLDHKFYVAPGIYKEACKLTTDDKLLWYGDYVIQTPEIKAIEVPVIKTEILEKYGRTGTVAKKLYDITVADNHNFFANGILTHNCQNMPWVLEDKRPMIVTEKIDGTSTTILVERLSFGRFKTYICSRNICFGDGKSVLKGKNNNKDNIYVEMAQRYKIPEHLIEYLKAHKKMKWACVQGESYGEGWQGNPLKLKTHEFAAFNFKDSVNGRLGSVEGKSLLATWGIPWVPIIHTDYILPNTVDELIDAATGPSAVNDKVLREGWVIRDQEGKLSFKAVSTEYLLKKKD